MPPKRTRQPKAINRQTQSPLFVFLKVTLLLAITCTALIAFFRIELHHTMLISVLLVLWGTAVFKLANEEQRGTVAAQIQNQRTRQAQAAARSQSANEDSSDEEEEENQS